MYQAVSDFSIRTPKGNVEVKAGQIVALPEDTIKALLKKGKIKGACIKWDSLSKVHLDTARSLATEGVNFRLSTPAITQAEDALNQTWLNCLRGRATLTDFEAINQKWAFAVRTANKL